MSLNIWTQCGGASNARSYRGLGWRVVESQQLIGTRKLVDSENEHELLEQLIDTAKPAPPRGPEFVGLHYLLAASFRHPPLRYGSRFGVRADPGIWYGAEQLGTAFAEVAYYRLVFLSGTTADLEPLAVELTAFQVRLGTERAIDLTVVPFREYRRAISSPVAYQVPQALGRAMRIDEIVLFRYRSARDVEGGANVGVFTPRGFRSKRPHNPKRWHCVVNRRIVEMSRKDFEKGLFSFPREQFLVEGVLPAPAA